MAHRGKKSISEKTARVTVGGIIAVAVILSLIAIYLAH